LVHDPLDNIDIWYCDDTRL